MWFQLGVLSHVHVHNQYVQRTPNNESPVCLERVAWLSWYFLHIINSMIYVIISCHPTILVGCGQACRHMPKVLPNNKFLISLLSDSTSCFKWWIFQNPHINLCMIKYVSLVLDCLTCFRFLIWLRLVLYSM